MTLRTKVEAIAAVVIFVVLAWGMVTWHTHALEMARAQAKAESLDAAIKQNAEQIQRRDAEWKQREDYYTKAITDVRNAKQAQPIMQPVTPQQPVVVIPAAQMPAQVQQSLPASPFYTVLTEQQAVDWAKFKLKCDETTEKVGHCEADKATLTDSLDKQRQETGEWKKAAKGGSWLKRVAKDALKIGIGVGIGIGLSSRR